MKKTVEVVDCAFRAMADNRKKQLTSRDFIHQEIAV
jgi:hypothetical protein